jgi:hypothetical protein
VDDRLLARGTWDQHHGVKEVEGDDPSVRQLGCDAVWHKSIDLIASSVIPMTSPFIDDSSNFLDSFNHENEFIPTLHE